MKLKKVIKKCVIFAILETCIVSSSNNSIIVKAEDYNTSATAVARADSIRWYYKEMNGKFYRRLYNLSTETWLTDWILC